ncbi:hypothetical protein PV327_007347 [Microctonus hyperodae]|uniref:Uncharacterized protein n=1 Tax=Microctonus hyperodae TaxID=165561 RepID=A0AA39FZN6_MICHY|nr:hypothetical protein PV327_007347 [Microctonus hyperodae]
MKEMSEKVKFIKIKGNMRGSNIWIDDDLTTRETEIRRYLRKEAEMEEKRGKRVSLAFIRLKGMEISGDGMKERGSSRSFSVEETASRSLSQMQSQKKSSNNIREDGADCSEITSVVMWNLAGINTVRESWPFLDRFKIIVLQETWVEKEREEAVCKSLSGKFVWKIIGDTRENNERMKPKKGRAKGGANCGRLLAAIKIMENCVALKVKIYLQYLQYSIIK